MKKIILFGLAIVLFTACQKQEKRYTQHAPEIDIVKQHIDNYNTKNYDTSVFADTAKSYLNNSKNPIALNDLIAYHQANDLNYSSRGFTGEDPEYEMVITDDGETWVNCWLDWQGTLKGNGKVVDIPVHLTYRFIDGKIVREVGMWDATEVVLNLQQIEAEKNMSIEDKVIKNAIDNVAKAWNTNDKDLMLSSLSEDMTRNENGNTITKNASEYVTKVLEVNHNAFPDFKVNINNYKIVDNKVHLDWTCTGTNTQPFQGNPATNKTIELHGHSIWTINSDGKFISEDAYFDNLSLVTQLGYSQPTL